MTSANGTTMMEIIVSILGESAGFRPAAGLGGCRVWLDTPTSLYSLLSHTLELSLLFLDGASQSLLCSLSTALATSCLYSSHQVPIQIIEDCHPFLGLWKLEWTKQVVEAGVAGDNNIETNLVCDSPTSSSDYNAKFLLLVATDVDFNDWNVDISSLQPSSATTAASGLRAPPSLSTPCFDLGSLDLWSRKSGSAFNLRFDLEMPRKWECCCLAVLAQIAITSVEDEKPKVSGVEPSWGIERTQGNESRGFHKDLNLLPNFDSEGPNLMIEYDALTQLVKPRERNTR
nr:hypothetical protein CFP56_48537 [Quercus suber]